MQIHALLRMIQFNIQPRRLAAVVMLLCTVETCLVLLLYKNEDNPTVPQGNILHHYQPPVDGCAGRPHLRKVPGTRTVLASFPGSWCV